MRAKNVNKESKWAKTRFEAIFEFRIAKTETHLDKFSKDEIIDKLKSGEAKIEGKFVLLTTNNDQIMAVIENINSL